MKAAVLHRTGTTPAWEEFPDPIPQTDDQALVTIKAASIKQLDLLKASGNHYTSYPSLPTVVGVDGVGVLENGQLIYAMGLTGMLAEKALVNQNNWIPVPETLDVALAAALPNALFGSDAALIYRARLKKGDTVLINGATGVAGTVAVQVAKYHGAATVIATGRNPNALQALKEVGADEVISLEQSDAAIIEQVIEIQRNTPVNIILDYLWGHPVELLLSAFSQSLSQPAKLVAIGEMAGATISLASGLLRSKPLELIGSGFGSITPGEIGQYMRTNLPAMLQLAAEGKLTVATETVPLAEIAAVWPGATRSGRRTVVIP